MQTASVPTSMMPPLFNEHTGQIEHASTRLRSTAHGTEVSSHVQASETPRRGAGSTAVSTTRTVQDSRCLCATTPNEAQIAVTAALEAVAVQFAELSTAPDNVAIPEQLRAHVRQSTPQESLLNASEAAESLDVSRTTIYEWIEKKRMVGWNVTRQGLMIPGEQILGPRELVPGLDRVLAVIPQARAAWRFLSEESAFFDEPRRPLDVLKDGDIDAVVAAAETHGEAFS